MGTAIRERAQPRAPLPSITDRPADPVTARLLAELASRLSCATADPIAREHFRGAAADLFNGASRLERRKRCGGFASFEEANDE